jgi:hypothetical protein
MLLTGPVLHQEASKLHCLLQVEEVDQQEQTLAKMGGWNQTVIDIYSSVRAQRNNIV